MICTTARAVAHEPLGVGAFRRAGGAVLAGRDGPPTKRAPALALLVGSEAEEFLPVRGPDTKSLRRGANDPLDRLVMVPLFAASAHGYLIEWLDRCRDGRVAAVLYRATVVGWAHGSYSLRRKQASPHFAQAPKSRRLGYWTDVGAKDEIGRKGALWRMRS